MRTIVFLIGITLLIGGCNSYSLDRFADIGAFCKVDSDCLGGLYCVNEICSKSDDIDGDIADGDNGEIDGYDLIDADETIDGDTIEGDISDGDNQDSDIDWADTVEQEITIPCEQGKAGIHCQRCNIRYAGFLCDQCAEGWSGNDCMMPEENSYGTISGKITNLEEEGAPNVLVNIGVGNNILNETITDANGEYIMYFQADVQFYITFHSLGTDFYVYKGVEVTLSQSEEKIVNYSYRDMSRVKIKEVSLNGSSNDETVQKGAEVSLSLSYTSQQESSCPGCVMVIAIGIEKDFLWGDSVSTGTYPGNSGSISFSFTAPSVVGVYRLLATHSAYYSYQAEDLYESELNTPNISTEYDYLPIGTLTVLNNK